VRIRFLEEARDEFLDAVSYYEDARVGLDLRFAEIIDRSVLRIADHPEHYRARPEGFRRLNVRGFPHYIAYIVRGDILWVLAVAHASRKPHYWISRREQAQ
jgi:plasmid stabilization system protein ParE